MNLMFSYSTQLYVFVLLPLVFFVKVSVKSTTMQTPCLSSQQLRGHVNFVNIFAK